MRENELSAWEQLDAGYDVRRDCNGKQASIACGGAGYCSWLAYAVGHGCRASHGASDAMDAAHDAADAAARKMGWKLR